MKENLLVWRNLDELSEGWHKSEREANQLDNLFTLCILIRAL